MQVRQIIVEYRRDVTVKNLGDKLLDRLVAEPSSSIPDELYDAQSLVKFAMSPETHGKGVRYMNMLGKRVVITQDDYREVFEKYKNEIIEAVLHFIENRDPTPNKAYTQWLARAWANDDQIKLEDLNRGDVLGLYNSGKRRNLIKPEHRDINQFKTYKQFEDVMLDKYDLDELDPEAAQRKAQAEKGTAKEVYNDDKIRVIHPQDEAAACYYGRGTIWCTAGHTFNRFNYYNNDGPMFILLPKNPNYEGEKYQIHLASGQFMDKDDDPVDPTQLINEYPEFFELLKTKLDPEHAENNLLLADDKLIERLANQALDVADEVAWDMISDWESNDEYWHKYQAEEARNRGYVDDEGDIDWDRVHEDDDLNDYSEYNDEANKVIRDLNKLRSWNASDYREWSISDENTYFDIPDFDEFMARVFSGNVYAGSEIADYFDDNISTKSGDNQNLYRKRRIRDSEGNIKNQWVPIQ